MGRPLPGSRSQARPRLANNSGARVITLEDGTRYTIPGVFSRRSFRVLRNGEPVFETRVGRGDRERITFRGPELRYTVNAVQRPELQMPGDNAYGRELRITDASNAAALTLTVVRDGRWRPQLGRAVVGPVALGVDTPLMVCIGFNLLWRYRPQSGGTG